MQNYIKPLCFNKTTKRNAALGVTFVLAKVSAKTPQSKSDDFASSPKEEPSRCGDFVTIETPQSQPSVATAPLSGEPSRGGDFVTIITQR